MATVSGSSSYKRGLSLVELMVAMAIGTVLCFSVVTLFLRSKISHLQDAELARLQENGRYALRYLSHELGMAGYMGGEVSLENVQRLPDSGDCYGHLLDARIPVQHVNDIAAGNAAAAASSGTSTDCLKGRVWHSGSDMLLLRRSMDHSEALTDAHSSAPDPNTIYLWRANTGAASALVRGADAVYVSGEIWRYFPQLLFVRPYSADPKDGIPSLCRLRLSRHAGRIAPLECLVEGVQELQVEFGIDDDGDQQADRYYHAPGPQELRLAVVARVFLLLRAIRPVHGYRNAQVYQLGGKRVGPFNDSYYRRLVQATVSLRNAPAYKS